MSQTLTAVRYAAVPDHAIWPPDHIAPTGRIREDVLFPPVPASKETQADEFPAEYRGSAFVTLHGSWNRGPPTGYKVVRLLFKDGKPTGEYEDVMTGFVVSHKQVWGRPVGIAVAKDGSLIVTEDGSGTPNGRIWELAGQSWGHAAPARWKLPV